MGAITALVEADSVGCATVKTPAPLTNEATACALKVMSPLKCSSRPTILTGSLIESCVTTQNARSLPEAGT